MKNKIKHLSTTTKEVLQGLLGLTFIAANGVGAYVLWFSSDSLTLKVVAFVLALHSACMALSLSMKK